MFNVAVGNCVLVQPYQVHGAWPRIGEDNVFQDDKIEASQRQLPHHRKVACCEQCENGRDGPRDENGHMSDTEHCRTVL